jgi:hypothetical protein
VLFVKFFKRLTAGAAAVALSLSVLSGCDKLSDSFSRDMIADTPFSAVMEFDTEKIDFIANVKRLGMGMWEMTITEPQSLAGLTVAYDGENVSSTLGDFTETRPLDSISDHAVFLQLFRAVDNAVSLADPEFRKKDGKSVLDGVIGTSPYEIILSPETGLPMEIKFPTSEIEIYISEFTVPA